MMEAPVDSARGTTALLGQSVLSGLFRVVNIMILTRLLLQAEMGQVAVLSIIYGFLQFLGTAGLNHAAPLVVSEDVRKGHLGRVRGFLKHSLGIVIVTSLALVVVVGLMSPWLVSSGVLSGDILLFALIVAPFSSLEAFLDSFLLARYKVRFLAGGRIVFDFARVAATVGLVLVDFSVFGVVVGWLVGELVACIAFILPAFRDLPADSESIAMRPVLAFALPNLVFQAVDVTMQNTDRIILLHQTDLTSLGVYDVILGMLFLMSFVSLSISTSLYPVLTRFRVDSQREGRASTAMGGATAALLRYVFILLFPVAVIASLNSYGILREVYGVSYATFPDAPVTLSLLVFAYCLWGLTYSLHTVLRSVGESRFFIMVGSSIIVFEIIGCWYLTAWFGVFGAALIRSVYVLALFAASLIRLRQLDIRNVTPKGHTVLRVVFASSAAGLLLRFVGFDGLIEMAIWGIISLAVYILLLLVLREPNSLDFRVARSVAPSRLHPAIDWLERRLL